MGNPASGPRVYRFGMLELDARTGELFRDGQKTQLRDQPLQLLLALLEHPSELVTREELTRRLWPADTFVDFDRGLNKAVKKLREALEDSAEQPQFIETLPRKGYRFIAKVTQPEPTQEKNAPATASNMPIVLQGIGVSSCCRRRPTRKAGTSAGPPAAMRKRATKNRPWTCWRRAMVVTVRGLAD
jgi:DNA-binding winged helix-turn-helix (wHTH) protein